MEKKKISREGLEKLQKELQRLVTVERPAIAEKLKEARSYGDLSENAEYDEARREQQDTEMRIKELEDAIANAEVVEDDEISADEVGVGVYVTLKRLSNDKIETFKIVGTSEVNIAEHKISDESPIGKGALKKKIGDIFEVETPGGLAQFEVLNISISM